MSTMDLLWDCMNISSRIAKQIETSDSLVPKNQQNSGLITPHADLQEASTTIASVKTTFWPFVTSAKKSRVVSESPFEICLRGIKDTLSELHQYLKDLEREFSVYTWKTQKARIYKMDFALKLKLDQFSGLFGFPEENGKEGKGESSQLLPSISLSLSPRDKKKNGSNSNDKLMNGASLIADSEGRELWAKSFGENTAMVPWNSFLTTIEAYLGISLKEDEEFIKGYLDFAKDDSVSSYEFALFLKLFGPLKTCCQRWSEALKKGLLCGFVPAAEATLLLEGKREGTYMVRCSKTNPGSFAVTFVDNQKNVKHCLLFHVPPNGLTLKNPPTVYGSLIEFAEAHVNKLKHPLGNKYTLKHGLNFPNTENISTSNSPMQIPPSSPPPSDTGVSACVVCMDAPFETVFLECGHMACCQSCSNKLDHCPICRNVITRIIPIFRAS